MLVEKNIMSSMRRVRDARDLPEFDRQFDVLHDILTHRKPSLLAVKSHNMTVELRNNHLYPMLVFFCNDVIRHLQNAERICISSLCSRPLVDLHCGEMLVVSCLINDVVRMCWSILFKYMILQLD